MATLTVTPNPAAPGQTVDVDGSGFNPKYKFALTTVDPNGVEVGQTTNTNRPRRDGSFKVGINVPSVAGACKVRAYQQSVKVAEASVTVQTATQPEPPPPATTVTVTSISDLYAALAANKPDITLAPGTYSGGINIDARFAGRTIPGVIHCDGVVMNGGGLLHHGGAHDLDWQGGITFANWTVGDTGVMVFGGWDEAAAHHIAIRKPKILSSVKRTRENATTSHGVYFSHARGGCHDILIEDLSVDASASMCLASGIHMDHADNGLLNAYNVTVRRLVFKGNRGLGESAVQQPIILWTPTVHDWTFEGGNITNASGSAIRFESRNASNILFKDIVSTNSGGFYSSMGANPPGVTFQNCDLR